MAESFSHPALNIRMADLEDEDTVLDVLRDILSTDRVFYGTVRFLDGQTRNHIVAAHLRNTGLMLNIVRSFMDHPPPSLATMTMHVDLSGNMLRNFLDPVAVTATPAQIAAASETNVRPTNETCSICRDPILVGTRLRACGHHFHASCIDQWLGMNTRCPVCRHDIREPAAERGRLRTPSPQPRRPTYSDNADYH
jgi:hypothetical protein